MILRKIFRSLFIRLPAGLFCLFFAVAIARTFPLLPLDFSSTGVLFPFSVGLGIGLISFSILCKFRLIYIFAHELTHWFLAKLFRRRTGRFQITGNGGAVEIENPNIWIVLGPYFIPLYTLLWAAVYFLLRQIDFMPVAEYASFAVAGMGVTYAYHLWMTCFALSRPQSDLKAYGFFLSISLIICLNLFLVFLGVLAVTAEWRFGFSQLGTCLWKQIEYLLP